MAKINAINNQSQELTIDPGASGDSFVQFSINGTGEFRIGVDDDDSDKFKISQGSALGSNDTFEMTAAGECTMPLQSAFSAYLGTSSDNETGDGTAYSLICDTEIFDQNSDYNTGTGVFTAPVTGRYVLMYSIKVHDLGSSFTNDENSIITSNRTYFTNNCDPGNCDATGGLLAGWGQQGLIVADMDASDTAYVSITISGSTKTIDIEGGGNTVTRFAGYLAV